MSGIIPKEQLGGIRRWEIGSFDAPKSRRPSEPKPAPAPAPVTEIIEDVPAIALPTAADIERIHEEARATGYEAGYQAGFEEGRQAGEQAARDAAEPLAQNLLVLTDNLQQSLSRIDQEVGEQLLALATEIAAQVLCGAIAVKSDVLLPIIREATAALPLHHAHVTLRLNPVDAAHVRSHLGEQLAQTGTQIIDDNEIGRGGCLVRANASEVDATIETRWKRVLEAIGMEPRQWLNP